MKFRDLVEEVTDVELYPNYLLIGFKSLSTAKITSVELFDAEDSLTEDEREWLRKKMETRRIIGFNSRNFDLPIIYGAINGLTVSQLREISHAIIEEDQKPWDIERSFGFKINRRIDHIDLIEVAPGKASLKIYNGRLHGKRMQDLPFDPMRPLTRAQADEVYRYWVNDIDATVLLHSKLKEQLALRTRMSVEYGVDLRSKSDAQVAEAVIKAEVTKLVGVEPVKPEFKPGRSVKFKVPDFLTFYSDALIDIVDNIEKASFKVSPSGKILMPDFLKEAEIRIGAGVYRMGIGGLHSSEKTQAVIAKDGYRLFDRDVTSFYPRIIINQGLFPKQLGWAFLKVFKKIVGNRVRAKGQSQELLKKASELMSSMEGILRNSDGPSLTEEEAQELYSKAKLLEIVSDSLKITINGSFGKFGNRWSILFSPDLLIQTTISGQLSLLMLIDWLEHRRIEVVSANTDGIVIKCHERDVDRMLKTIKEWEEVTGYETEEVEYSAVYSRDVNNYIAVYKKPKKPDQPCKTKGAYAYAGFMKNPVNEICIDAVIQHIVNGKSLYKTISYCRDLRKFITVRTVKGGAIWGVKELSVERISAKTGRRLKDGVKFDTSSSEFLGKAIRWYYSSEVTGSIHYKINGNKVPKSDGAKPVMELPDEFPSDIDYARYLMEARRILYDIGFEDL